MQWNKIERIDSSNESVSKFVFMNETSVAESVLYKYPTYRDRTVICCSTQSGCPVGCRFCGAGDSFVRSLSADEIASQPQYLLEQTGVDPAEMGRLQIMFMSMGEPLLNLKGLCGACHVLHEKYPNAALPISTIGPATDWDQVLRLSEDIPTIGLQFSIHESNDEARNKLIPFSAKLTLVEIAEMGQLWHDVVNDGRRPFFNYCAHPGNVSDDDADRLLALFNPLIWNATISVICEREEHVSAANERQRTLASDFEQKLVQRGFNTRMFDPAGQDDVGGGCGQLWYVQDWMRVNSHLARPSVGRSLPVVHAPRLEAADA